MPIAAYKLNNGKLTLGSTPEDVSCQLTSIMVNPTENVDTEDAVHVLCGETLDATDTVSYAYTLSGTGLQDLEAGGFVDYTWTNAGDEVPFVFQPDLAQARQVSGTVRIIPLAIGGEVPTRPTSDFEWTIIGIPTFGVVALEDADDETRAGDQAA